ncbi:MAG: DUF2723 domain-containing protein, partial [Ignavibacteriaceae bacterium]|nr:DUF2723 domain-containing protein [Ignavibacteriaceae bacterium]
VALFAVYPGVVKYLPSLMTKVGGDNAFVATLTLVALLAALGYGVYFSKQKSKPTMHLIFMSTIFVIMGFTTFAMVIIRANQDPPMNENKPDKFTELESYLNREQYGDFPTFKRRFATEPHQQIVYSGYTSDLDFFWSYQMNHMMTRYLLWNYAGRQGWAQDDGPNIAPFNGIGNIFSKAFGIHFEGAAKDSLFGIPFLLGLLGIYFHFRKDWKMASVFMVMFIFMGYLTAFYQNQQQPQPRERDYFYVGAFFVYSLWIAFGIRGLIDLAEKSIKKLAVQKAVIVGILAFGIVLVPVKMAMANYYTHDRSQNWVPWDYSYNLLQSCAPNSILFTNGDNDTFPLWYLQDVEGVRRDVRIANLSLLNTNWYIKQLKNNDPYHVGTVKMRLNDTQIDQLRPIQWSPRDVTIPLPGKAGTGISNDLFQSFNLNDSSVLKTGALTFKMNATLQFGDVNAIRVQDIMVKEIVENNIWERPIYFAVTCSEDSKIGLSDYLRMEGMALRVVPEKKNPNTEFVNEDVLHKQLYNENPSYSVDYKPGFKFRGLNNPDLFLDENHQRMTQNYRNAFLRLSIYYVQTNRKELALKSLDLMEQKMPRTLLPMEPGLLYEVANIYYNAGSKDRFNEYANEVESKAWDMIEANPNDATSYYSPYRLLMMVYETQNNYQGLERVWEKLSILYPTDPNVIANVQKYRSLVKQSNVPVDTVKK